MIEVFCLQEHGESTGMAAPRCNFFRITALGYGRNPNTTITLQEMFLSL
jgi:Tfp pilus assembly protein PilX